MTGTHFSGRPLDSGLHEAGCFYGGPDGEMYWFAVEGCPLAHDGDLPPLVAAREAVEEAWAHLSHIGGLTEGPVS